MKGIKKGLVTMFIISFELNLQEKILLRNLQLLELILIQKLKRIKKAIKGKQDNLKNKK